MLTHKSRHLGAFFLLGVLFYWIGSEVYWKHYISADRSTTLPNLVQRFGQNNSVVKTINGKTYLILSGPLPPFYIFALPSSRPIYIFTPDGELIDWRIDPAELSEDDDFRRLWF